MPRRAGGAKYPYQHTILFDTAIEAIVYLYMTEEGANFTDAVRDLIRRGNKVYEAELKARAKMIASV